MPYAVSMPEAKRPQALVRMPPDVHDALDAQAERTGRSLAAHILFILRIWLSLSPDERFELQRRFEQG